LKQQAFRAVIRAREFIVLITYPSLALTNKLRNLRLSKSRGLSTGTLIAPASHKSLQMDKSLKQGKRI
jgi:hypothetical protein